MYALPFSSTSELEGSDFLLVKITLPCTFPRGVRTGGCFCSLTIGALGFLYFHLLYFLSASLSSSYSIGSDFGCLGCFKSPPAPPPIPSVVLGWGAFLCHGMSPAGLERGVTTSCVLITVLLAYNSYAIQFILLKVYVILFSVFTVAQPSSQSN